MKPIMPRDGIDSMLFQALRAIFQFERDKVARFGLTYEGIYLLQYLRRFSPCRMGEVADEMRIPISTCTRVAERLEKRGFVSRCKDPDDRRKVLLSLETTGEKVVREVEDHSFERLVENLEYFNRSDYEAFTRTALSLNRLLNGPAAVHPGPAWKREEKR